MYNIFVSETGLPFFIAIGASGGEGMTDMVTLLHLLPKPVHAVVLAVLHRPFDKISHLRDILARGSGMPVVVAGDAERFVPGTCYIGEPDGHLSLRSDAQASLVTGHDDKLRNRTVDTLFNPVAAFSPGPAIGIILSGSLDDGSRGLAAVHAASGVTMVLDPRGKWPPGMQQNAIQHDGPVDIVGTAHMIAEMVGRVTTEARHL
ncbi:chemotaxis protein CheB (plasmid) [Lichenicola cladoniae]|uniref:protein-glutamate methylesterase n=1 Tax=Lichenicola cladoniae TaxID=1484109 RepID=A0A6M8HY20_9PROT|nr:chemotaxis protein CheB [Acetobacteraceae bacterium]QKE92991.1 chemotaxis protein CheB [Lichenicola cladoniae]